MARKESSKAANGLADIIVPARQGYFVRTARAVYALVFLLPIIILYEVLVFLVNPQLLSQPVSNVRGAVVSFIWVQNFLHYLGMDMKSAWLFAPAVVIIILLVLQFASRQSWKVRPGDFPVMVCECMIFAIPLVIFSLVLNRAPSQQQPAVGNFDTVITCGSTILAEVGTDSPGTSEESRHGQTVGNRQEIYIGFLTGIGAGIY